ncbi:S-methyl-5'-thioadenosine phosphorylase [Polyangium sp. y55x31]|uniref:S-methyl-5'-thioadenosine phosphorylase n=1 Tax=Polyangium sp. y55x31 TaxID=3042688 RepID=UPI002482F31C|nr:S-methyl-5'-thioadenosine phosphorylase [Polyangium sp. y55x31]MDI1479007.1 S-methyl-5'-thioadenosine phosphorylase [Polyangium sp. y55x31]
MSHVLGVIGGSGVYALEDLEDVEEVDVETPYGPPSDVVFRGRDRDSGTTLLFLPRHGRGHRLSPTEINYRANVCALKKLGATHLVSVSAVGSMREEIPPGDLVIVDQFIDLTKRRTSTFFDGGVVGHVAFADPVCPRLSAALGDAASQALEGTQKKLHRGGTYVCIEGPQFSTRAESLLYRSWGVHVIGMTAMPEAKLAREAELPYALLAMSTDYDCWHATEEAVTVEAVIAVLRENVAYARRALRGLSRTLPDPKTSPAHGALANAIMTRRDLVPEQTRARLSWLLPDLSC